VSLINASTTGLVTASVWLHRYDLRRSRGAWFASVLVALLVAVAAQIIVGTLTFLIPDLVAQVAIQTLATIALLFYLRIVIHEALMAEGAVHEIGPDAPCPECHRVVPTMLFCPACGVNRSASSKHSRPRVSRS
jgi:hypothetical protein